MAQQYVTDLDTARRIADGDAWATENFVLTHYASVSRFLRHLTRHREEAEDLTQQTFIRAKQQIASYRAKASLRTWLFRIALHEYTHWKRRRHGSVSLIFDPDIKPGVPFFNLPQDRLRLASMLAKPPLQEKVGGLTVSLYAVISDDYGQIGAILTGGDPRGTEKVPLQIDGLRAVGPINLFDDKVLSVNGRPGRLETTQFLPDETVPGRFILRVPVMRRPLTTQGRPAGFDRNGIGWAEYRVDHVLRTESIDAALPGYVPSDVVGTGVAAKRSISSSAQPPKR